MMYFIAATVISPIFYVIVSYMSYVSAAIFHKGVTYKLIVPVLKTSIFIALCYISIISDVVMFHGKLYSTITVKNGLLLLLVAASLINAKTGKGIENEHGRE